jgi:hypothetical protein
MQIVSLRVSKDLFLTTISTLTLGTTNFEWISALVYLILVANVYKVLRIKSLSVQSRTFWRMETPFVTPFIR